MSDEANRGVQLSVDHDAWLRRQVELAVCESNDPDAEWVSQAEVKRPSAIQRALWLNKAGLDKSVTS